MTTPTAINKHLWEVEHSYYCNEGNYFSRDDTGINYKSLSEFMSAEGNSDMNYNLLFRWDWDEADEESGNNTFTGDIYYRNGKLKLFWIGQRQGIFRHSIIDICRADEPAVIEFLRPRLKYLMELWEPLTEEPKGGSHG